MKTRHNNISKQRHVNANAMVRAEQLLGALMDGDIPVVLRAKIQRWFVSDMSVNEKYSALEKLFMELEPNLEPDRHEYEQLQKICRELGFEKESTSAPVRKRHRVPAVQMMLRIAAVMVSAVSLIGIGHMLQNMTAEETFIADVTVSTSEEATKRIILPDGSQVWLNSSSRIEYGDDFLNNRFVSLDGEAFFEVTKDTLSPFRVKAGDMVVEVLGTEFSVKSCSGEPLSEVILASGCVKVAPKGGDFLELAPNEHLTFNAVTNSVVIEPIVLCNAYPWRVLHLDLVDLPLKEALCRIASYYGMELSIRGEKLSDDLVNFDVEIDLPLREVLDIISGISGGFNYEITETEIIVTQK